MKSWIYRKATKKWLNHYNTGELSPSVRAVFLGDLISNEIILHETYDALHINFLVSNIFPNLQHTTTALDIGANIGNHALIFSKHFDRVIAFEPNPQVALLLRANTMGRSIDVVEKGLSDMHGNVNFHINNDNLGGSSIVNEATDVSIEVETLDRLKFPLGIDDVSFLKIDVEGHEAKVLAGAQDLLKSQHPIILLELHHHDLAEQVKILLRNVGYDNYYILVQENNNGVIPHKLLPKPFRPVGGVIVKSISNLAECNVHSSIIASTRPLTF